MNVKKSKAGIIATIFLLVLLVIFSNLDNKVWERIVSPFTKIAMGFQEGYVNIKHKIFNDDDTFYTLESLEKKNKELKQENEELKSKVIKIDALEAENKTLKEFENLTNKYPENDSVPGYIIQKDFSNYSKVVIINVGKKDGIEEGMTVVSENGLVGYVVSAEEQTSKVQTIVDTASAVGAIFENTNKSLVTRGILNSNNEIKGTYIDNDVIINEGDKIVTSGIGGIYPKNITIGNIKEIVDTKNKSNRYVFIETAVDFDNLNNILVIKN